MAQKENKPEFVKRDSIVSGKEYAHIRYTKRLYEFYNQDKINLQKAVEDFEGVNLHQVGEDFNNPNRQRVVDDLDYRYLS